MSGTQVLGPITAVKVGAYGAAEGACVDIGPGVQSWTWTTKTTEEVARAAAAHNASVDSYEHDLDATGTTRMDEISLSNLAMAVGGTVSGNDMTFGTGGASTKYCAYVYGLTRDGRPKKLHLPRVVFPQNFTYAPTWGQTFDDLPFRSHYDFASAYPAKLFDAAVDTTPPTIVSATYGAGTALSGAALTKNTTPVIKVTFSEPVKNLRVDNFFVVQTDGSLLAATPSVADSTGAVWQIAPTLPNSAKSFLLIVAAGTGGGAIADIAGNLLAPVAPTPFTCA